MGRLLVENMVIANDQSITYHDDKIIIYSVEY